MINLYLSAEHVESLSSQAFDFNLRTKNGGVFPDTIMKETFIMYGNQATQSLCSNRQIFFSSGGMLYYVCKKNLPRRIVPLWVPFLGLACCNCAHLGFGPYDGKTVPHFFEGLQECNNLLFDC